MVLLCAAHFLEAIFGRGHDKAVLQSPVFSSLSNTCVYFDYWISSPKILLRVFGKTSADSEFQESGTVLFGYQEEIGGWSEAAVALVDGVIQFQIVADKTGVSNNIHHVMVDNVYLQTCPDEGR